MWSYGVHKNLGAQWVKTGQGCSIELEMERIGPMVVELQHPQGFGCLMGMSRSVSRANDYAIVYPQQNSSRLEMERTVPVVEELQCRQGFGVRQECLEWPGGQICLMGNDHADVYGPRQLHIT